MMLETIVKRFLADLVRWCQTPPKQPGDFLIRVTGEDHMAMKNITEITLPALPDGNPEGVVRRDFIITQTGDNTQVFNHAWAPGELPNNTVVVKLTQGVEVKLSLADSDAAGNKSLPRELIFTPTDVTPPSEPGAFQMKVTGEVNE